MWCAERTLLNLNKGRSGFPRLSEYWMPAGACPERSRRAGMTSFPRKRESRKRLRRNYAHASYNLCVTEHYATDRFRFYRDLRMTTVKIFPSILAADFRCLG